VLHIFSLLPVDCRLRCMEVCRGWREALLERSLWTRLELTAESGVRVPADEAGLWREGRPWDALLRCAAARAGGTLQSLRVDANRVSHASLLAVATANAGALRELHAHDNIERPIGFDMGHAEELLDAAPQLRVFATELECGDTVVEAVRLALRNEAPFGSLHVRQLIANLEDEDEADVSAFTADVAAHASLRGLTLQHAPLQMPAALDAVVDAALTRQLHSVYLYDCALLSESAPGLARLLGSGALTTLSCEFADLLDAPAAALLAAALRANSTLTSLSCAGVFDDAAAGAVLLGALTGHASLRVLALQGKQMDERMDAEEQAAAGASLGALVAANAPALTQLDVAGCDLGAAGLRPLLAALQYNTHLRELACSDNIVSMAFARNVLLPAVRANTSLRKLITGESRRYGMDHRINVFLRKVNALVAARGADAAQA
jgi:hypothetical protein